jgi:hypothetical protein
MGFKRVNTRKNKKTLAGYKGLHNGGHSEVASLRREIGDSRKKKY